MSLLGSKDYVSSSGVERSRVRIHLRAIPKNIPDIDATTP
jgi:hypothetical protein